ncbi:MULTISPECIES: hypothetical protein [Allobaculum]|uniref:hypothetical protein n=1 Tax=Allobaculum TaxID=174708 RepID=UPI001E3C498E|nr:MULTISPECIES: hypothetical protein [Allobaculum]UNT92875.1 hypothetical protein KWG61_12540 [Allobaculum sp. Allo2]
MILHLTLTDRKTYLLRIANPACLVLNDLLDFLPFLSGYSRAESAWYLEEEHGLVDGETRLSDLPICDQDHLLLFPITSCESDRK